MKNISILVMSLLLLSSCKKTKLEGDLSVFVGTWEWKYCVKTIDLCEPFPYDSVITSTPSSKDYTCTLIFEEKGKLIVKKNGKKEKSYRLNYFRKEDNIDYIVFYFDSNKKSTLSFSVFNTIPLTIRTTDFPEGIVDERIEGCEDTHSVFEKID